MAIKLTIRGAPPAFVYRTFRCDADHEFEIAQGPDDPPPEDCPHCAGAVGAEPVPGGMHIGTDMGKAADRTFNRLASTSAERAALVGDPSLKVTNLRDDARAGEAQAMPVNNEVTQYASAVGHDFYQGSPAGMGISTESLISDAKNGPGRASGGRVGLAAIQDGTVPKGRPSVTGGMKGSFGGGF